MQYVCMEGEIYARISFSYEAFHELALIRRFNMFMTKRGITEEREGCGEGWGEGRCGRSEGGVGGKGRGHRRPREGEEVGARGVECVVVM